MVMRTTPFPEDLFQDTHPNHQVLLILLDLIVQNVASGIQHRQRWQLKLENSNWMSLSSAILIHSTSTTTRLSSSSLLSSTRLLRTCLKRSTSSLCRMRRWMSSISPCPSMTTSRSWRMLAQNGSRKLVQVHPKWL